MQDIVKKYVRRFTQDHVKKKKFISVFVMLAVLVASGVIWQMKLTGISATADAMCGLEEHQHDESCYEKVLICGYEENTEPAHVHDASCYETHQTCICGLEEHQHDENCYDENGELICEAVEHTHGEACYTTEEVLICGQEESENPKPVHVHTDACYEERLVCGKEEHTHTIACMSDRNADLESEADWEATLPETLTHKWAEDVLAVANSQLGYTESTRNYILDESGERTRGYTRYGQWYGNSYGDWCAMYVSWCLHYAEIPEEAIPYEAGCYAWTVELDKMGLYHTPDVYTPEAGDIIFFYSGDGINHVGLVESVDQEKKKVHTIEGNAGDVVCKQEYFLTDKSISGYASLKEAEEKYRVEVLGELPKQTLKAEIYADTNFEKQIEDSEVITVSGRIPAGAAIKACPAETEIDGKQVLTAYDITIFLEDGTVYEPEESLKVTFTLPKLEKDVDSRRISVYYVPDEEENEAEKIKADVSESKVEFTAEHFSVYALAVERAAVEISTEADLRKIADGGEVVLSSDITLSDDFKTIELGAAGTLDLNGHTITCGNKTKPLFQVIENGSLIIKDSAGATDEESSRAGTSANEAGQLATYDGNTLTYYVTETEVVDSAIGATQETLVEHKVTPAGKIVGGGVSVESGGKFTMEGGAICDVKDTYAVNSAGGTVTINGGYICGNSGGIYADGGNVTMNNGVIAGNQAEWGGGIHVENGQFNMFGGIISGNSGASGGGGVYVNVSTALLYHGYITNNVGAEKDPELTGGGGVLCHSGCTVEIMSGAAYNEPMYITANKACSGGGITAYNMLNGVGNTITMNDGYVTGNLATKAEGGGMAIRAASNAFILGGYITNNVKATAESWGGGGIFGQESSGITILHALITNNVAKGFGGGVTGCSTGTVLVQNTDGAAIYGNHAEGSADHMASSNKSEDHAALEDPVFMQDGTYQDYFCALVSMVKSEMLGGGSENWYGSADGERVNTDSKQDVLTANIRMGLNANPIEKDIANAQKEARVFINGNSSDTHGGGLLANGIMILGNNEEKFEIPGRLTFNAKKALNGEFGEGKLEDYRFGFRLLDEDKEEICIVHNDKDGLISFPKIEYTEPGKYIYYMEELQPEYPSVTLDTTVWKFEVIVAKESIIPDKGDGVSSYYLYKPTNCYIYRNNKLLNEWQSDIVVKPDSWETEKEDGTIQIQKSVTDFHVDVFDLVNGEQTIPYTFDNTFADKVSIEVHKVWEDADGNETDEHPEGITVYLTKNGERYESTGENDKSPVILNNDNGWSYQWENLPGYDEEEKPIDWGIEEEVPEDWEVHLSYSKPGESEPEEPEEPEGPQPVTNPENGKEYHIGNLEASRMLVVGDGDKTWDLPQWNDQNLPNAKYEIEGNESQFFLKQDAKYLYLNPMTEWDGTHYFLKKSSEFKTSFSVDSAGRIYTLIEDKTYYISTDAGSGVTTTVDPSSVMILYKVPESPSGGDTPGDEESNDSVVTITNTPESNEKFYGFTVKKVDANDETILLPGAQFQLVDAEGKQVTFTKDGNGVYHYDGRPNQIKNLVVGADGTFKVEGLPEGEYTLIEIKAPEGYMLPEGEKAKQTVTLPSENENLVITIENEKQDSYVLPETGGIGTIPYIAGGMLCILLPFWYGLRLKRTAKRRKR